MNKKYSPNNAGSAFEALALKHLRRRGLRLLTRNYNTRYGEIDLIMKSWKTIVFIEVRKRKNTQFGHPIETVDHIKQRKIINTAYSYLQEQKLYEKVACRFDVVGVTLLEGKYHLTWCKNAFTEKG